MARKRLRYAKAFEDYHVVDPKYVHRDRFGDFTGPAIEKLAEYEASGLTPGQVALLQKELQMTQEKELRLERTVESQEAELMLTRSEREYFRSRYQFYLQVVGGL